jgi:hypothetical protein
VIRLKNNTKQQSKIGFCVIIDPSDKNAFIFAPADSSNILGIIAESVPYRAECNVITSGEALVYVTSNVQKGDIIRSRKSSDNLSSGACKTAQQGDAPYLQVGLARESRKGLVKCQLLFSMVYSDEDVIPDIPTALSELTDDSTHRLVTDTEKATWNAKADESFVIAMSIAL